MKQHDKTPVQTQRKGKKSKSQIEIIKDYLHDCIATASMTEQATGVHHKNICRHKRQLEKAGQLWQVMKRRCIRTGHTAWYLTTNPSLAPKNNQLSLFSHGK
jgi:hypothetical protein